MTFAYLYAEGAQKYKTEKDSFLYIAVNEHWEMHSFRLPIIPAGMKWHLAFDSSGESYAPGQERLLDQPQDYTLGPRTSAVLVARLP